MASLTDIYQVLLSGVQQMGALQRALTYQTTSTAVGPTNSGGANFSVSVSSVSTLAAPANLGRRGLYVFNTGAVPAWIAPSTGAVAASGSLPLQPMQGMMLGPPNNMPPFTSPLSAISSASTTGLTVWEFLL